MSPTPGEKTTHHFSRSQRLSKRLRPADEKSGRGMTGSRSGSQPEKIPIKGSDLLDRIIEGITNLQYKAKETVFSQGDPSDGIFFIQKGKVKLTVVSARGREAIVGVLGANEFVGDQCLAGQMFREMTVTALEDCSLLRIERGEMLHSLRKDSELSMTFVSVM